MDKQTLQKLNTAFESFPSLKLVYLFGSQVTGRTGPLSDYDFALYIDEKDSTKALKTSFLISHKIGLVLKSNDVDIVVINHVDAPELKYAIITKGELIFEREPYKLLLEPKIYSQFFDFRAMLRRHKLTKT